MSKERSGRCLKQRVGIHSAYEKVDEDRRAAFCMRRLREELPGKGIKLQISTQSESEKVDEEQKRTVRVKSRYKGSICGAKPV